MTTRPPLAGAVFLSISSSGIVRLQPRLAGVLRLRGRAVQSPMRLACLLAALAAAAAAPAAACLPDMTGRTEEQRLRPAFEASTDIVYGIVTRGARKGGLARFRVIHVYKGSLEPGAVIGAGPSFGFDPPPCLGTTIQVPGPSAGKGQYGVIAFNARHPALNWIDRPTLELMFKLGWIRSAQGG